MGVWAERFRLQNELGRLKPSIPGILNVEQDDGENLASTLPQRFLTGTGRDEVVAEPPQHRAVHEQFSRQVIDHENIVGSSEPFVCEWEW